MTGRRKKIDAQGVEAAPTREGGVAGITVFSTRTFFVLSLYYHELRVRSYTAMRSPVLLKSSTKSGSIE
jgi:hypothetical protein